MIISTNKDVTIDNTTGALHQYCYGSWVWEPDLEIRKDTEYEIYETSDYSNMCFIRECGNGTTHRVSASKDVLLKAISSYADIKEIDVEMKRKNYVIDTETTGLSPYNGDELLQVSIIDTDGNILYNEYVRPLQKSSWPEAQAVNGISPEMVAGCKTIEEQLDAINSITSMASAVIGYNTPFDLRFLASAGVKFPKECKQFDVMQAYSERHGKWDEEKQRYKWCKLTECAKHYGYDWNSRPEAAHNSLADCFATLHCYKALAAEKETEYTLEVKGTMTQSVTVSAFSSAKAQDKVWDMIDRDELYFDPQPMEYAVVSKDKPLARTDKPRLFVDMDGTLARFHDEVRYLERMWEEGFFRELKPFQELVDGIRLFKEQHPDAEVYILSAAIEGEPPYCRQQKHEWLNKYLPEIDEAHRIFTEVGKPKSSYIEGGIRRTDILLDDYNKGLEEWQRDGGTAIKCVNNINHRGLHGELWQGELLRNSDEPSVIAAALAEVYSRASRGREQNNIRTKGR